MNNTFLRHAGWLLLGVAVMAIGWSLVLELTSGRAEDGALESRVLLFVAGYLYATVATAMIGRSRRR